MKSLTLTLILALVSFSVGDKIPDFLVPGQCPNVDTEGLWRQQQPNHYKVTNKIMFYLQKYFIFIYLVSCWTSLCL